MLSKNDIKLYRSLKQKKFRKEHNLYIIEGKKGVEEIINSNQEIVTILTANENFRIKHNISELTSLNTLKNISTLKNSSDTLCVAKIPEVNSINFSKLKNELILLLDDLQDPGNLGTVIRIADWYGIKTIICSENTVDNYNPKTVQATMGSITRTNLYYTNLSHFITQYKDETQLPVFATLLEGENIYKTVLNKNGAILIGNEGNGISDELIQLSTNKITIPRFGEAESLNAGIATAIICSEFKRQ